MRTLDATLQAAMDSGDFDPIVRAAILDPDDYSVVSYLDLAYYKINGVEIDIEFYDASNSFPDTVSLERGALINGTEYTIFSGIYHLDNTYKVSRGHYICSGSIVEPVAVNVLGDVSYHTLIDSVMAVGAPLVTPVFKTPAAAWLGYQFFADGLRYATGNIYVFFALLKQKYCIHATDNGINSLLFFSAADTLALAAQYTLTLTAADTFSQQTFWRQFTWKDENKTLHAPGPATYVIHNLGYLESTDSPPDIPSNMQQVGQTCITCIPNLKYQTGDCVLFDPVLDGYTPVKSVLDVTEIFDAANHGKNKPAWYMELRPLNYFSNTSGGFVPTTVQYTSAYIELANYGFNNNLTSAVTNVQLLADAVDDLAMALTGTGVAGRLAKYTDANHIAASNLIGPVTNVLTLEATGTYTATVPATGTVALLGTANVFTTTQYITPTGTNPGTLFYMFAPNLSAGNDIYWTIGKAASANNSVWMVYHHAGDGWASNYFSLDMYGFSKTLTINAAGNIGFGDSPISTIKMTVFSSTTSTDANIIGYLAPSMNSGVTIYQAFGKALSTRNTAFVGYHYISDGSTSNYFSFDFYGVNNILTVCANGRVGVGVILPQAKLHVVGSADVQQLLITGHTTQSSQVGWIYSNDTTNNAMREVLRLESRNSTASTGGAAGYGPGLTFYAESATDANYRQQGQLSTVWATATDATRKARSLWSVWDTGEREGIRIEANGSAAMVGFLGAAAVVRQTGCVSQEEGYIAGSLDTEAEIISALNTTNVAVNLIRSALIAYGLFTDE